MSKPPSRVRDASPWRRPIDPRRPPKRPRVGGAAGEDLDRPGTSPPSASPRRFLPPTVAQHTTAPGDCPRTRPGPLGAVAGGGLDDFRLRDAVDGGARSAPEA